MQGKKSFIAYSDWKDVFDELPNEDAGILIKHIFAYVNDENPESDSVLIRAVFANIKSTLKRDLGKWENQLQQRVDAGKRSAEVRALKKSNETQRPLNARKRNPTDSVSVNVTDTVTDNDTIVIYKENVSELENSFSLNQKVGALLKVSPEVVDELMREFIIEQDAKEDFGRLLKDMRSHFVSWSKIEYKKQKQNHGESRYDKFKRVNDDLERIGSLQQDDDQHPQESA